MCFSSYGFLSADTHWRLSSRTAPSNTTSSKKTSFRMAPSRTTLPCITSLMDPSCSAHIFTTVPCKALPRKVQPLLTVPPCSYFLLRVSPWKFLLLGALPSRLLLSWFLLIYLSLIQLLLVWPLRTALFFVRLFAIRISVPGPIPLQLFYARLLLSSLSFVRIIA